MATGMQPEITPPLRLERFSSVRTIPFRRQSISAWRVMHQVRNDAPVVFELEAQPAYFAMIYMQQVKHCDLLADGSTKPVRRYERGNVCLVDLSEGAAIRLLGSIDGVGVVVPFALVGEMSKHFPKLPVRPRLRRNAPDPVLHKLAMALLPFLGGDMDSGSPAVRHILAALAVQMVCEQRTFH